MSREEPSIGDGHLVMDIIFGAMLESVLWAVKGTALLSEASHWLSSMYTGNSERLLIQWV